MTEDQTFICILFFIALYIAAVYGILKGKQQEGMDDFARYGK